MKLNKKTLKEYTKLSVAMLSDEKMLTAENFAKIYALLNHKEIEIFMLKVGAKK